MKLTRQLYSFSIQMVKWFWDLTRDFWAENAKNKLRNGVFVGWRCHGSGRCNDKYRDFSASVEMTILGEEQGNNNGWMTTRANFELV